MCSEDPSASSLCLSLESAVLTIRESREKKQKIDADEIFSFCRFEVLGPEGDQPQADPGFNDFEIVEVPPQTLPSISEDPDPLEGQDYVPAHTVAHNTVPGTDTRKWRTEN